MANMATNRTDRYKRLTQDQQILHRPDTTIGAVTPVETNDRVFDATTNKFVTKTMVISDAVINIFLEVLHNSADNKERSEAKGVPFSGIVVAMDNERVNIRNDGEAIPVVVHPQWKAWIPATLFGDYNTSSNYDDDEDRKTLGRNGFGVKLVNTFSTEFYIDIVDPKTGLRYQQMWKNNKTETTEPSITKIDTQTSMVSVTWKLDFKRFGLTTYTQDYLQMFERHCVDVAYSMKTVVTFNNRTYDFRRPNNPSPGQQLNLSEEQNKKYLSHFVPDDGDSNTLMIHGDNYELIFVDMPNNARTVSFVNGKCMQGGAHITCAYDVIKKTIIPMINDKYNGTSKSSDGNKKRFTVNVTNLKRHLGIFINARLTNPTFKSQYKVHLVSPKIHISITEQQFKKLLRWNFVKALKDDLIGKTMSVLKAGEIKGRRARVSVKNAEDANLAGTKQSLQCSLILTEGDSAKGYAVKWISCFSKNEGRNYYGIFPLRGKPLNVRNSDAKRVVENKELLAVKKLLGIKQDFDYSTQEQLNTLRYGSVLMMVDSDVDGKHILGLVLNMFHALWPGLLYRGYIRYLKTPILRVTMGRTLLNFYTEDEYEAWRESQGKKRMTVRYYKGLGSSSTKEIKSDFREAKCAEMSSRDFQKVTESINLAFSAKETKMRKVWLTKGLQGETIDSSESCVIQPRRIGHMILEDLPIQRFIFDEMIEFSKADNRRSIPAFADGLKVSQRKALWASFKAATKLISLTTLVGSIQQATKYHHGETSMQGTVIGMAQSYIWKNNLPYFAEEGNYGTRNQNGKDHAAARYIYTRLRNWVRHVFLPEDDQLLEHLVDENTTIEPKRLLPIIPMWLINGAQGIGTGFSTNILKHSPSQVIDVLIWMCQNDVKSLLSNINLKPWYRGFNGIIDVQGVQKIAEAVELAEPERQDDVSYFKDSEDVKMEDVKMEEAKEPTAEPSEPTKATKYSKVIFNGIFQCDTNSTFNIRVTELPLDVSTLSYNEFLKSLEEKGLIKRFSNNSNDTSVDFTITDVRSTQETQGMSIQKVFKLSCGKTTSNMVLLNDDDIPIKGSSTTSLLLEFYNYRLPWYHKRKEMMIDAMNSEIEHLSLEAKLIKLVVEGKIVVFKRPQDEIRRNLDIHLIPYSIFEKLKITRFTKEEIDKILGKIEELRKQTEELKQKDPKQMWIDDLVKLKDVLAKEGLN